MSARPTASSWHLLRDLMPHISRRRRKQFVFIFLLMIIGAFAEVVTLGATVPFISVMTSPESVFEYPWLQELLVKLGWPDPDQIVLPMTLLFLLLVLATTGVRVILLWISNRFVYSLGYDLGVSLYRKVLHQPYSYHTSHNTSEIIAAIEKVQRVINKSIRPAMEGAVAVILVLGILSALILIAPTETVVAGTVFAVMYTFIALLFRRQLLSNSVRIANAQTGRIQCIQEGVGSIRDVILHGHQKEYVENFSKLDAKLRAAQTKNAFLSQSPRYLVEGTGIFLIVGLAYALSMRTGGLAAALPMLGALALGAQRLLPLLQKIFAAWANLSGQHQIFADVNTLLSLPEANMDAFSRANGLRFARSIELNNVSFLYGAQGRPALDRVNIAMRKGACIGIVGASGSGKTTLVDIIMGLLEPTEGALLVDGEKVTSMNCNAWRTLVAHVPQHIFLSDSSIAENIALGIPKSEIDIDRVERAAYVSCIAHYIESLPDDYDASVGERGVQLSGGQRQRIGIARAIYRNACVLIFDEATNALDSETERAVLSRLATLETKPTVIMIAHREYTLRACTDIIRVEGGRVWQQQQMPIQETNSTSVSLNGVQ